VNIENTVNAVNAVNTASFETKVERLRELARDRGVEQVVLRRSPNLAWLLEGRVHVAMVIDAAACDAVITADEVRVVTNAIEANRLRDEELPAGVVLDVVPWTSGRDARLPDGPSVGTDQASAGRVDLSADIERLRQQLDHDDIARLESVCQDAAIALGAVVRSSSPSQRETDVAASISAAMWTLDLEPVVLLVAGDRRAPLMRHPLPTGDMVGTRLIASVCVRRKGLIGSVTRVAHFGRADDPELTRYEALLGVEAAMLDATVAGAAFKEPLLAAQKAYPDGGFPADEWTRHHQGGPTGYLPRDWPATPDSTLTMLAGQPVAWNPTAAGWKVEDTWLVTPTGPRLLSGDPTWPTTSVGGRLRPQVWHSAL
jgi:Xaa-Pro aminopeptidase